MSTARRQYDRPLFDVRVCAQLANLEQRLKEDQQRLGEFKRMVGERGGESEAVKMIFPSP